MIVLVAVAEAVKVLNRHDDHPDGRPAAQQSPRRSRFSSWSWISSRISRFCSGSHELRVIKRDDIFSLSIPKLPANYEYDH